MLEIQTWNVLSRMNIFERTYQIDIWMGQRKLGPRKDSRNLEFVSFKLISRLDALWICPQVNATRQNWWFVNIGSGNGLVPSGNKPLPETTSTKLDTVSPLGHNGLTCWVQQYLMRSRWTFWKIKGDKKFASTVCGQVQMHETGTWSVNPTSTCLYIYTHTYIWDADLVIIVLSH